MTEVKISTRQASTALTFILLVAAIGLLTVVSWLLAFANEEQGPSTIGLIGTYAYYVFRFPTHNLIWLKPDLISSLAFPGLFVNVLLYSALATYVIVRIKKRRVQQAK